MQNYNFIISKVIKNKYKSSTILNKNFLMLFLSQRKKFSQKINLINNSHDKKNSNDFTKNKIVKFYKKNTRSNNDSIVLKFYKKYETNLSLKKKYNSNYKKMTNKETGFSSYIYLGILIAKNKYLNKYQKINCILKILDKLSMQALVLNKEEKILLKKLIKIEKNYIEQIR
jgi:hypothetical protein|tara:strand:+ start:961 stop:1473 length:513 start_codon:yes stop_codon:yes gene_type:complete